MRARLFQRRLNLRLKVPWGTSSSAKEKSPTSARPGGGGLKATPRQRPFNRRAPSPPGSAPQIQQLPPDRQTRPRHARTGCTHGTNRFQQGPAADVAPHRLRRIAITTLLTLLLLAPMGATIHPRRSPVVIPTEKPNLPFPCHPDRANEVSERRDLNPGDGSSDHQRPVDNPTFHPPFVRCGAGAAPARAAGTAAPQVPPGPETGAHPIDPPVVIPTEKPNLPFPCHPDRANEVSERRDLNPGDGSSDHQRRVDNPTFHPPFVRCGAGAAPARAAGTAAPQVPPGPGDGSSSDRPSRCHPDRETKPPISLSSRPSQRSERAEGPQSRRRIERPPAACRQPDFSPTVRPWCRRGACTRSRDGRATSPARPWETELIR